MCLLIETGICLGAKVTGCASLTQLANLMPYPMTPALCQRLSFSLHVSQ